MTTSGTTEYEYDEAGRLVAAQGPDGYFQYTYDAAGRVTSRWSDGEAVTYEYDSAGRLSAARYPDETAVTYAYDALGRKAEKWPLWESLRMEPTKNIQRSDPQWPTIEGCPWSSFFITST